MKILAIRGENLASLEASFEVDLTGQPLGNVGLFAITGPTGAGKSTLLDALCLALFDRTPRLSARGGVLVGRADDPEESRLSSNDVRSILRRGAAEGFAEVEFLGREGRRYRARWAVRRANRRVDGRVQAQAVTLEDAETGAQLGGTKTETLQAIEARLGLSFDQFRRSALLAQGEFAAFLKADAGQRAELLERVSGTQLYGLVSMAAHQRAQEARAELAKVEAVVAATRVLGADERAALEGEAAAREAALRGAREALEAARAAALWHEQRTRLAGGAALAEQALAAAEEAWRAAAEDREALRAVERARPLRGAIVERDRAARAADEARREREAARGASEAARAAHEQARVAAEGARAVAEAAEAERRARQPELAEAAACDRALAEARRAREEAEASARAAETAAASAGEAAGEAARALARDEAALGEVEAWLAEHAAWGGVAREAGLLRDLWRRHGAARREREAAEGERLERVDACERLRAEGRALAEASTRAAAALEAARMAREAAEAAEAKDAGAEARSALEAARRLAAAVERLERAAGGVEQVERRLAGERATHDEARAEAKRAEDEALAHTGRALEVVARRDEAAKSLERMKAAMALEGHRADLVDGEPCPLCGSCEHPWAAQTLPMVTAMAEQQERVSVLTAESDDIHGKLLEAQARLNGWRQTAAAAATRVGQVEGELAEARRRWEAARREGGLEVPEAVAAARAWLASRADEAARAVEEGERREAAAAAVAAEARGARERHEAARAGWQAAQDAARGHERRLLEAEHALGDAARRGEAAETTLRRVADEIGALVAEVAPGWRSRVEVAPERLTAEVDQGLARWEDARGRRESLAERVGRQRPEVARLDEAARRADAAAGERRGACDGARGRVEALEGQRAGLLGGRAVAEVSEALERRVAEAGEAARLAEGRAHEAARAVASAVARGEAADGAVRRCEQALEAAEAALAQGLASLGLVADEARALLARDEASIEALRARLDGLATRRHEAAAVSDERRRQLAVHDAAGAPAMGQGEAEAAVGEGAERVEAAEASLQAARVELRRDDEARARLAEVADALARARADADLWQRMAELIGSHDGKKLRVFAQSLTLDLLLAHANHHLQDLARRYQLVRVPGHDLDLQVVDRDMGDEARSIQSLSGGESFLVSLALALGLSSLSSRTTPVESLFIDEGFGSLDARTLETALDALDALQATGRQVGLISHVPGVAERIGVRVHVQPEGAGRSRVRIVRG